uniref:RRM domain-containing protein n=1 Tax=Syphacia muris TaxID=451379 RepID=A0A0N5AAS8_9BILA
VTVQPKKRKVEDEVINDNSSASDNVVKKGKRKKVEKEDVKEKKNMDLDEKQRTIFVGNAPVTTQRNEIKKLFSKFGTVESVRLRSLVSASEKLTKKVTIKHEYSSNMHSVNFYVKFKDSASVSNALAMNGEKLGDHTLRVDSCVGRRDYSQKTTVFVGNLPHDVYEEDLSAGQVAFVRIVRDQKAGVGKGFGFVGFSSETSVPLALKLNGSLFKQREIRKNKKLRKEEKRISNKILSTKRSENLSGDNSGNKKRLSKKVKKIIRKRNNVKTKTIMK